MKELELPTKDLKTGTKVVGKVASGTFEAVNHLLPAHWSEKLQD